MKFLHVMRTVDPRSGGPIEALIRSEPHWRRRGHRRTIVSLDLPGDPGVETCPIPVVPLGSATTRRLKARVPLLRYGFTGAMVPWLKAHVGDYDAVVVNGLWNYSAWAAAQVLPGGPTPYYVFTHGMLDPWFRKAHPLKHWAKQLSWWLGEGVLIEAADRVLFTTRDERTAAAEGFWPYRLRSAVCGYGTSEPPRFGPSLAAAWAAQVPGLSGRPYILFLGRLHPKKGCDLLIEAFDRIRHRWPDLQLVMAGPDSDGWSGALKALATRRGIADRIHWPGMVEGEAKWGALYGAEAFSLPSHGENFGMAVVEAMACGRPVLISDKVNIAGTLAAEEAGLVGTDTVEGCAALLCDLLARSPAERAELGERGRHCFERHFLIDRVADQTLAILTRAGLRQPADQCRPALWPSAKTIEGLESLI